MCMCRCFKGIRSPQKHHLIPPAFHRHLSGGEFCQSLQIPWAEQASLETACSNISPLICSLPSSPKGRAYEALQRCSLMDAAHVPRLAIFISASATAVPTKWLQMNNSAFNKNHLQGSPLSLPSLHFPSCTSLHLARVSACTLANQVSGMNVKS